MIRLDGAQGEGGGQILRTALALSAITGRPFTIEAIRAGRDRPGLLRQHLTGVRAVAELCGAEVTGDTLGSGSLTFRPGEVRPGDYAWAVGSAGSAGLVLQAALPPLLSASGPSTLVIDGGTHNPASPPAPFLTETLAPLLRRMGPRVTIDVDRCGFYPAGGGRYTVRVDPAPLVPIRLVERGPIAHLDVTVVTSNMRRQVAVREIDQMRTLLGLEPRAGRIVDAPSPGPGNALWIAARVDALTEVFTAFGRRGVPAEQVAAEAVAAYVAWRDLDVPVGPHLADQLLVPLALAGGGELATVPPTPHTTTNAAVIGRFLDVPIRIAHDGPRARIVVG